MGFSGSGSAAASAGTWTWPQHVGFVEHTSSKRYFVG